MRSEPPTGRGFALGSTGESGGRPRRNMGYAQSTALRAAIDAAKNNNLTDFQFADAAGTVRSFLLNLLSTETSVP